jgi:hypothetical protein
VFENPSRHQPASRVIACRQCSMRCRVDGATVPAGDHRTIGRASRSDSDGVRIVDDSLADTTIAGARRYQIIRSAYMQFDNMTETCP